MSTSRSSVTTALAVAVFATILSGCGGGGGTTVPPPDNDSDPNGFTAQPSQATVRILGDLRVTVPAGTFSTPTTVSISRHQAMVPEINGFSSPTNAGCRISLSGRPTGPIYLEPTVPAGRASNGVRIIWRFLSQISGSWVILSDVTDDLRIKLDPASFVGNAIDGVIGRFLITPPETDTGLTELVVDPRGNRYSVTVIVHGFNSRAEEFQLAAEMIRDHEQNMDIQQLICGFRYDYRQSIATSAEALAGEVTRLREAGYENFQFFGHSAGAIVIRHMLEYQLVPSFRTEYHAKYCYFANGAHHGSVWANAADFVRWLEEDLLNDHSDNGSAIMATCDSPVIADLLRDSPYLRELNQVKSPPLLGTGYYLVGATGDLVVGTDGGRGDDIAFEEFVPTVRRRTLSGNHSNLVMTRSGLSQYLETWIWGPNDRRIHRD